MARSHHRKKHKEHLRQFKQSHDGASIPTAARSKASVVFGILGALIGFAVCYFATDGSLLWASAGLAAGGFAGYFIGKNIDKGK